MRLWISIVLFCGMACLLGSGASAAAESSTANLVSSTCDTPDAKGRPTSQYSATWNSGSTTPVTFVVSVSNRCTLEDADKEKAKECSASSGACSVTCTGQCSVTLRNCQLGRAAWIQVSTPDKSFLTPRVAVPPPKDKCPSGK